VKNEEGTFEMFVVVNGKTKEVFSLNSQANIVPDVGEEFEVKVVNNSSKDVMCGLTIDGVEVLGDGWSAIIPANKDYTFAGFSKDDNRTQAFLFAPLAKESTANTSSPSFVPDPSIGLISCTFFACENMGPRESSEFTYYSQSPNVQKSTTNVSKDKKKNYVITGGGQITRGGVSLSKNRYRKGDFLTSLEIRYNAIGEPVPKADMDVDNIDYE